MVQESFEREAKPDGCGSGQACQQSQSLSMVQLTPDKRLYGTSFWLTWDLVESIVTGNPGNKGRLGGSERDDVTTHTDRDAANSLDVDDDRPGARVASGGTK